MEMGSRYELSDDARGKRAERRRARTDAERNQAEFRRRETLRVLLFECAGYVIPEYAPGAFHVNKRWPLKPPARTECEGFLRCTDPGWSEANRDVCRQWVRCTWVPAAWLVRRRRLKSEAIAFDPPDPYEKETRRLFKRLLVADDLQAEAILVADDLVRVREQLAEDRRALGQYFVNLWASLRRSMEAASERALVLPDDRFQRAFDSVELVRAIRPDLCAQLDPLGPWSDAALSLVWRYLKETSEDHLGPGRLQSFRTWANYVRKGRRRAVK